MADAIVSTLFVIAVVLFIIVLPFRWLRRRRREAQTKDLNVRPEQFEDLRAKYFALTREELFCPLPANPAEPWGVIMEIGYEAATVTTVTFSEGTSRVFRSTGGGFFSAGPIESVRIAGGAFLKRAQEHQPQTTPASVFPRPRRGQVSFYFRTDQGIYSASAPEDELGDGHHRLSPLYYAGLRILHEFLQLQKQQQK